LNGVQNVFDSNAVGVSIEAKAKSCLVESNQITAGDVGIRVAGHPDVDAEHRIQNNQISNCGRQGVLIDTPAKMTINNNSIVRE
jgi:nitrous oxidase accessory protein NosD